MHPISKKHTAGFTLIELLVVLVILGLLAGMVGPNVMKYIGSSKTEVARTQLNDLSAGLDLFKLDVGRYPNSEEGLLALIENNRNIAGWNGPYLRKKRVPLDPWNKDYVYQFPGVDNDYELYTLGADGKQDGSGEDSDISSWQ